MDTLWDVIQIFGTVAVVAAVIGCAIDTHRRDRTP